MAYTITQHGVYSCPNACRLRPDGPLPCVLRSPPSAQRALLSPVDAVRLMALFKVLASDTRLRLLHALVRAGELSVTDLARTLGMTPQAVSNQLQRLVDRRIVAARRNGNSVHYRITDPCVPALLDQGLCLVEDSLTRTP